MLIVRSLLFGLIGSAFVIGASRAGQAASDTAAASLLARHKVYVGWSSGDGSVKSLRATGTAVRAGVTVARFSLLRIGAIYRSSESVAAGEFAQGFTGSVFWQSNQNGFTTRTIGEAVKFLATEDAISDEGLGSEPAELHGTATIEGVSTTVVRVTPPLGLPVDLYIDPATGAYKRIAIDPDGRYAERYDVLSYATVGSGKRVVSSWRFVGGKAVYTYATIEANTAITTDELHPPKAVATWTFGPPEQTVPVNVTDRHVSVDAVVNGHIGHFILDTGAGATAVTDSFARMVGAKRRGNGEIVGIGGSAQSNVYRVDTIAFGGSALHDVTILTGLDERIHHGESYDGYIGFDLLAGALVELDLDTGTMRILDPANLVPDSKAGIMLVLDLTTGSPRVPMTVAGHSHVLATIDSGNSGLVLFGADLISRDHVRFMPPSNSLASEMLISGVNGEEVDQCGRLESLELGPISYRPVPACASLSMEANDVLVGFEFFRGFNYVFDYPDGEMLITPRKNHVSR